LRPRFERLVMPERRQVADLVFPKTCRRPVDVLGEPLSASPGFWMRELTTRLVEPFSPASSSRRRSKSGLDELLDLDRVHRWASVAEGAPALYSYLNSCGYQRKAGRARLPLGVGQEDNIQALSRLRRPG